jgi:hypothetical protein
LLFGPLNFEDISSKSEDEDEGDSDKNVSPEESFSVSEKKNRIFVKFQ